MASLSTTRSAAHGGSLPSIMGGGAKTRVLWLRNNLRVDDNPTLIAASDAAKKRGEFLLPMVCLDAAGTVAARTVWGNRKVGARRMKFQLECVADLAASLEARGSGLLVSTLSAAETLRRLGPGAVSAVHLQTEVASEEASEERAVQRALAPSAGLERSWDYTLHHLDDLPAAAAPRSMGLTFTPWKDIVERKGKPPRAPLAAPATLPALPAFAEGGGGAGSPCAPIAALPTLLDLGYAPREAAAAVVNDPRAALAFVGGEGAARARLQGWMFDRGCLASYFETRNGMVGADYSSKLAPWLALGCVSARRVFAEAKRFEEGLPGGATKSTVSVVVPCGLRVHRCWIVLLFLSKFAYDTKILLITPNGVCLLFLNCTLVLVLACVRAAVAGLFPLHGRQGWRRAFPSLRAGAAARVFVVRGVAPRVAEPGERRGGRHRPRALEGGGDGDTACGRKHARARCYRVHVQPRAAERGLLPSARPPRRLAVRALSRSTARCGHGALVLHK